MMGKKIAGVGVLLACMLLALGLGFLAASGTQAQTQPGLPGGGQWEKVPGVSPAGVDLTNVFMLPGTINGLVTGKQGGRGVLYELTIRALDGWRNSITLDPVTGIDLPAPLNAAVFVNDQIWAVGDEGLIVHKTAGSWSTVPSPVPNASLQALQMLGDGSEGWAAGYLGSSSGGPAEPVLLHYTNGNWQRDSSITGSGGLNALHFAQGGGWVVGQAGIWHLRNGEWTKEQEPEPCPGNHCFPTYLGTRAITADEGWIVGDRIGICGICVPNPYILHRVSGRWQDALSPDGIIPGDTTRPNYGRELHAVTFSDVRAGVQSVGWAVGAVREGDQTRAYILETESINENGPWTWRYVPAPADGAGLNSVSAYDATHAIAVGDQGTLLAFGYGPQPPPTLTATPAATVFVPTPLATPGLPTVRVPDPRDPNVTYFPVVGHTLRSGFRDYWQRYGGLAQFGYPLTEEFVENSPTNGKPYTVQYFERARFEYHPENRPPYDVLLGLLGRTITVNREKEAAFLRTTAQGGAIYFEATGHNIPVQFASYWQSHGGLPVYGYPISEAFQEVSPTDGKPYLVQYFERNRLEYHPELPEQFRVSLGLLGVQVLQERGWIR